MSRSFPEFYAIPEALSFRVHTDIPTFPHVKPALHSFQGTHEVYCDDPAYAACMIEHCAPALDALVAASGLDTARDIAVTIDHDQVVATGIYDPITSPRLFEATLDVLSTLAASIESDQRLAYLPQPQPPNYVSFYHHPHWSHEGSNGSYLDKYGLVKQEGIKHQAHSIVVGRDHLLPFEAFTYTWLGPHGTTICRVTARKRMRGSTRSLGSHP